jgi:DNA (cytosine-5)-methyltransferase 1
MLKVLDLFSGIGGFSLGLERTGGFQTVAFCEIEPFCRRVLEKHWPGVPIHEDVRKLKGSDVGTVDVVCGGYPCQPFSLAGKRAGQEDDRHLWPEMLRAIREIQPGYVVGENVRGLTNWNGGLVFDEVQADLEVEGFKVLPFLLPACGVGAPHRRDRIWFVAHAVSNGHERENGSGKDRCQEGKVEGTEQWEEWNKKNGQRLWTNVRGDVAEGITADSGCIIGDRREIDGPEQGVNNRQNNGREETTDQPKRLYTPNDVANTNSCQRCEGRLHAEGSETATGHISACDSRYDRTDWQDFPTQPPVCNRNDGLSFGLADFTFSKWRRESIKALGNAVVPQVVYQIFKAIEQYEL